MKYYVNIQLQEDPECTATLLLNAFYQTLHRILAQQDINIGISFPDYDKRKPTLGKRLRLFGSQQHLHHIIQHHHLHSLREHIQRGNILAVPEHTLYCVVKRVQVKSNAARLRRRQIRRHGLDAVLARETQSGKQDEQEKRLNLPFVLLKSHSTQQTFPLFIQQSLTQIPQAGGRFNAYALNQDATLPWF